MGFDLDAAIVFLAGHARILERRRMRCLLGDAGPGEVLAALDAYRNPDGGYGWGLEPDLRSATSQPVAAMHALEVLAEVRDTESPRPLELCDWLAAHSLPGGMPFALPHDDTTGNAPHWTNADPSVPALMMTAQLAAQAHRLARHRTDLAAHPWLVAATATCLDGIEGLTEAPPAMDLMFLLRFLDAAAPVSPRAGELAARLAAHVPAGKPMSVAGGADGEVLHLLDFSPTRTRPPAPRSPPTP